MSDHHGDEAGFTLIETLVTVVIVGISVAVFVGGIGASIVTADYHRKQSVGLATIRNFAEAVKGAPYEFDCAKAQDLYTNAFALPPRSRTVAGNTYPGTSDHTAPSVTPPGANTHLLTFFALGAAASGAGSFTPPVGTTERWDVVPSANQATGQVTSSLADQAWKSASATGARTARSAVAGPSVAQSVSLQSGDGSLPTIALRAVSPAQTPPAGGRQLTLAEPTGTRPGDQLIAHIAARGGTATTVAAPAGWTLVDSRDSGVAVKSLIFERAATSGDHGPYVWTLGPNDVAAAGGIASYSGISSQYKVAVTKVEFWDGVTLDGSQSPVYATACPPTSGGLQRVSLHIESFDAKSTENVEVIKRYLGEPE